MATVLSADVRDLGLASAGFGRIVWAERDMPVLRAIRERFERETPLAGLRISACLHVTAETANLARTLAAGGAELVLAASDPLSTQDDVAASLVQDFGVAVFAVHGEDDASFQRHITSALRHRPNLTMDDGADLIQSLIAVVRNRPDDLHPEARDWAGSLTDADRRAMAGGVVAGLEGTTGGATRLRAMERDGLLELPILAVNDSRAKHLFDNRLGAGQSHLDGVIRATDVLIAGRKVVVCGYGGCGQGVALRARGLGAQVIVTEIDPLRAIEAATAGFAVLPMAEAARAGDLFLTVTGSVHVLRGEHFAVMRDGAMIANGGHSDRELELESLVGAAKTVNRGVRDGVDEYIQPDGRRLYVLGEGRLINLAAAHGHPAAVMDMSFAVQTLAIEWAIKNRDRLEPQVYEVPLAIDRWVARLKLQTMGISIDNPIDEPRPPQAR